MKIPAFFLRHSPFSAAAAGFLLAAAFAGCESADSYSISVSPGSAKLKPGQSATFTASGWSEYSWSLDKDGVGSLSAHSGKSVTFTAAGGVTNDKVTVTVKAVGSGGSGSSSSSSTNAPSGGGYTATAEVEIGG